MGQQTDPINRTVTVPAILASLLNRLSGLGPGIHMLVIVKTDSGARGVFAWAVSDMAGEPKSALANLQTK